MGLVAIVLFYFGFVVILAGVFIRTLIVDSRLSHVRRSKLPLTFSKKSHLQRLTDYKIECCRGHEDIWYKYLHLVHTQGLKFVVVVLFIFALAIVI